MRSPNTMAQFFIMQSQCSIATNHMAFLITYVLRHMDSHRIVNAIYFIYFGFWPRTWRRVAQDICSLRFHSKPIIFFADYRQTICANIRYLYKRYHSYYPFLFPSLFASGMVVLKSLEPIRKIKVTIKALTYYCLLLRRRTLNFLPSQILVWFNNYYTI